MTKFFLSICKYLKPAIVFFAVAPFFLFFDGINVYGASRYTVASGNWSSTAVWAATSGGTAGATAPVAGDAVFIERNFSVAVDGTSACSSIQFGRAGASGTGALTFGGAYTLTVSGAVVLGNNISGSTGAITFASGSTLDAVSLQLGGSVSGATGTLTMTAGGTLHLNGALTVGTAGGTWNPGTGTVAFDANNTLPTSVFTSFYKLQISSGTTMLGVALNSMTGGNLTVKAGATLALGAYTFGATTKPPTITLECGAVTGSTISGTGALSLGGNVTVNTVGTGTSGATISCPVALIAARTFTVADDGTSATDFTINGVISGAFALTKAGVGTMVLAGANTYTGSTTISAGTLKFGVGSTVSTAGPLGTTGGLTTVSSGAVLDLNGFSLTSAATEAIAIAGTGLLASPAGALTNTGVSASVVGGVSLSAAATITATTSGTLTVAAITNGTQALTLNGDGIGTVLGVIGASSGTVTKSGTGIWTLSGANTYTGATTVSAGTLKLGRASAATANGPLGTGAGGTSVASGAVLDLNGFSLTGTYAEAITLNGSGLLASPAGALTNTGAAASIVCPVTLASASTITATTSGTLGVAAVTNGIYGLTLDGAGTGTVSGVIGASTGTVTKSGTGIWILSGANTYSGATTISAGTLKLGIGSTASASGPLGTTAGATTVASGAVLDLNGYSLTSAATDAIILNGSGLTALPAGALTNTGAAATVVGAITLGSASTITATASGTLGVASIANSTYALTLDGAGTGTVSGVIGSTTGSLVKNGAGTWTLSGMNTYTGATQINAGSLKAGSTQAFGLGSAVTLSNTAGAVLDITGFSNTVGSLTGGGTTGGSITLGAVTLTIGSDNTSPAGYAGVISGTGGIIKTGLGALTLSGANTYSGSTQINTGTLKLGVSSTVSTSGPLGTTAGTTTVASGAVLDLNGYSLTSGATDAITLNGVGLTALPAGALTNTGVAATIVGAITLGSAATITATTSGSLGVASIANGTYGLTLDGAGIGSVSGVISSSAGSVTKTGAGSWTLSGTNTYTGATMVNGGSLIAGSIQAFGTGSAVTLLNTTGAQLDITGFSNTIGSLTGGGTTGGNVTLGAATLTIGSDNTSPAGYAGVISGSGAIVKTGTGVLTLSGANIYTGTTTVSQGTIKLGVSSNSSAAGPLGTTAAGTTVSSGAVLDLNGYSLTSSATEALSLIGTGLTGSPAGALTNTGGNASLVGAITMAGATTITATSSGTLGVPSITNSTYALTLDGAGSGTVSGVIGSGSGAVTKVGTGSWTFSGANTYTGSTTVSAGTLKLGVGSSVSTAGPLGTTGGLTTVSSGAVLDLNGYSLTSAATEAIAVNGTGLASAPAGALTNTGGNASVAGTISLSGAATITATTSGTLTVTAVSNGTNILTLDGTGIGTVTGVIGSSTGSVVKSGTGIWTLSGANTYTGATTISAGTLKLGKASSVSTSGPLGTSAGGTTVSSGAVLDLNGFSLTSAATEAITIAGAGLTASPAGAFTNTGGNASIVSGITLSGASTITATASGTLGVSAITNGTYDLTLAGAGSGAVTGVIGASTGGLIKADGGTWTLSAINTYTGATAVNGGTLALAGTGTKTFTGDITISSGGVWSETANMLVNVGGSLTNNGTFTSNIGVHTFTGAGKIIGGSSLISIGDIVINGTYTNNGVLTSIYTLNGTGTLTQGSTGTLSVGGTSTLATLDASAAGNTVNYTYAGYQNTIASSTYHNLSFSGGGVKSLVAANTLVNGTLTLTSGLLTLGSNHLTLGASSPAVVGSFGTTNMIVADGTGELRKLYNANGSYLFPIGDVTGTTEYSPVTINFLSGTYGSGAYVSTRVVNAKHVKSTSTTDYLNRYWVLNSNQITSFSANVTATYLPVDIVGSESNQVSARYFLVSPWSRYSVLSGNTLNANGVAAFGDFTGINNIPGILVSKTSLTTFTYPQGSGPSSEQSFTVRGTDLTTNITVTATSNLEISTGTGASFVAAQSNILHLNVQTDTVPVTTIYTRLKVGLPAASYNDTIRMTSDGATTREVWCTGTVTNIPTINLVSTTLTGFNYIYGVGPSAVKTFVVSGSYLTGNISIAPSNNYEVSTSASSGFGSTVTLTRSGQTVAATTIYVRLKTDLAVAYYDLEVINLTSTGAVSKTVTCSGNVSKPTITISTTALGGFVYTSGAGPSNVQSFTVSGASLKADVVITPSTNFEISTLPTTGFQLSPITLTQSGGVVGSTTIYVRLKSGLALGSYANENIALTTTDASTRNVTCSGAAVVNTKTIAVSTSAITGLSYALGTGPSSQQSFVVSGTSLVTNIKIIPTANFQISLTSGTSFAAAADSIVLVQSGGTVNSTTIYVRLKAGLAVGSVGPESISVSSSGANNPTVSCSGTVFYAPSITASGGGTSFCLGSTINLSSVGTAADPYWTGPNGFYSSSSSLVLTTNATTALNGTYTVTGSGLTGYNLLMNGDFEAGNTGFTTSYALAAQNSTGLVPEGTYDVIANPHDRHYNFTDCSDHTSYPNKTGKQMVVNGATLAGAVVWSQSVNVTPNSDYQFTYWVQSAVTTAPSELRLYLNGAAVGTLCVSSTTTCLWKSFTFNMNVGASTVANLELINQSIIADGNDFALDDISFKQILSVRDSVTVLVNPTLPVSVSINASATTVFSGTPVTFTASPVNGGSIPVYQWKLNGVNAGLASMSPTYTNSTLNNGDKITCVLISNYPCPTGGVTTVTSNEITMTITPRTNYWIGTTDSLWTKASNWTAGFKPAAGDDVEFANGVNNAPGTAALHDLYLDADQTIGNFINPSTTKRLIIPPGKSLIVNNSITTNGDPDMIYIQSSSTGANGSLIFHNVVGLPVQATVEMYSKASWNLAAAEGSRYKWQYFGIPVRSINVQPTLDGSFVRKWDETGTTISNHWVNQPNGSIISSFYGYEICQEIPRAYAFQGALENGDFAPGKLPYTTTALYPGQHIFANPYTAAINIKQLSFGAQTEQSVYLYNAGSYNDWLGASGETTPGSSPGQYTVAPWATAGTGQIPGQIPSMQGFLVKAMSDSPDATFGISYSAVVVKNTAQQRAPQADSTKSKSYVQIDIAGKRYLDQMWIVVDSVCSRRFNNGWDGYKILGMAITPQLFSIEVDGYFQVNAVNDMQETTLGFKAGEDSVYTLTLTSENLKAHYQGVYLVDLAVNKTIDITNGVVKYVFATEPTPEVAKRFKIVTRPYEKDAADSNSQVKVFSSNGAIFVQNTGVDVGQITIFDISGRLIRQLAFGANTVETINSGLAPGAYVVKCNTAIEEVVKRVIVR